MLYFMPLLLITPSTLFANSYDIDDSLWYVPWEVVVKYKDDPGVKKSFAKQSDNNLFLSATSSDIDGFDLIEKIDDTSNIVLMQIDDDKTVEEAVELLSSRSDVEFAEPNYIRYVFSLENLETSDPFKSQLWWLDYISWLSWFDTFSWKLINWDVVVWVIDNWVNYNHSDLKESLWDWWNCILSWEQVECIHWYDFIHNLPTPLPNVDPHWTHVAWIIAAWIDNWTWVIWVNPYAKIAALKIWRARSFTTADEIRAIRFAIDNGIKIINASYWSHYYSSLEMQAIRDFWSAWWLFVTAAWNKKENLEYTPTYPCAYDLDNIICVAAIDESWVLASYSNFWNKSVDIAAPWSEILSTIISWLDISSVYSQDFEQCIDSTLLWWSTWYCSRYSSRSKPNNTWYYFTGSVMLSWINLSGKNDLYLSFMVSCPSNSLSINYSVDWDNYEFYDNLWIVTSVWSLFTVDIPESYRTEQFWFWISIDNDLTSECVIDDVEVYEDPYVYNDNDNYWKSSWTSMATPFVAWLASLVRSLDSSLSPAEVKEFILNYGDDNKLLINKTVSWKTINVYRTLDKVFKNIIWTPSWLISSWSGDLAWNPSTWTAVKYYYEILDKDWNIVFGDDFIWSWFVENTWISINLSWDYSWRVQWIDEEWNLWDFASWYMCSKPDFNGKNISVVECWFITWDLVLEDNCYDTYITSWTSEDWNVVTSGWVKLDNVWTASLNLSIENSFWEKVEGVVDYIWSDSVPSVTDSIYDYPSIVSTTGKVEVWNLVSLFWVKEWICWTWSVSVVSVDCSEWTWILEWNVLYVNAPKSKKWSSECIVSFSDDEWNVVNWTIKYSFDTIVVNTWWDGWGGWWWGWGGGWWGWGWWSNDSNWSAQVSGSDKSKWTSDVKTEISEHNSADDKLDWNSWSVSDELTKPDLLELFDQNSKLDFSWYNNNNPSSIMANWYSVEFNNAYTFAHNVWVTTMDSIDKADMNWKLTRIAMAKMLSNYAMNVLGKKPANIVTPNFSDVSSQLNDQYWDAVTLAYQLWIMWIWIDNFRPFDTVTRAEFGTALSRMLYWLQDWSVNYYSTHLDKLYSEWIITNTDPKIKELRWYVMIMLMRSAKD